MYNSIGSSTISSSSNGGLDSVYGPIEVLIAPANSLSASLSQASSGTAVLSLAALSLSGGASSIGTSSSGSGGGGSVRRSGNTAGATAADALWLFARVSQFIAASDGGAWSPDTLGTSILDVLHRGGAAGSSSSRDANNNDNARVQAELFELLGPMGMDFLETLVERRDELRGVSVADYRKVVSTVNSAASGELDSDWRGDRGGRPAFGAGVSVMSQSSLDAEKHRRKAGRKQAKQRDALMSLQARAKESFGLEGDAEASATLDALLSAGLSADLLFDDSNGSGGGRVAASSGLISVDDAIASVGAGYGGAQKKALPLGTTDTTVHREGYKFREVCVPPSKLAPAASGSRGDVLVSVSELDPIGRLAFAGIAKLNRLQSELFDAAYRSNENLLVCAPTGAGKTNVAMLAVCRELGLHVPPGGGAIDTSDFKIVYVAPMKALAAEVVAKFSQRLAGLRLSVRELTGDMQLTKREIEATQVIVTTPEKWDVITRKAGDGTLVSMVRLLM